MTPTPSLRTLVRERTASAHEALEILPLMRTIASGVPSLPDYRRYLALQWRLHAPLEAALPQWVPESWRALRLVKAGWLLSDLQALGALRPAPGEAADIGSAAQALGILYVLEGGTLGLQVVAQRMRCDHPARATAFRFMTGYGSETGSNWRRFIARLEELPQAQWPRALDAACDTFAAFQRQFALDSP
jgi:heme oxygenase